MCACAWGGCRCVGGAEEWEGHGSYAAGHKADAVEHVGQCPLPAAARRVCVGPKRRGLAAWPHLWDRLLGACIKVLDLEHPRRQLAVAKQHHVGDALLQRVAQLPREEGEGGGMGWACELPCGQLTRPAHAALRVPRLAGTALQPGPATRRCGVRGMVTRQGRTGLCTQGWGTARPARPACPARAMRAPSAAAPDRASWGWPCTQTPP